MQTATFLYVGTQVENGTVVLNQVANVVEKDIPVKNVSSFPSHKLVQFLLYWLEWYFS
jgi:hypothetical protein